MDSLSNLGDTLFASEFIRHHWQAYNSKRRPHVPVSLPNVSFRQYCRCRNGSIIIHPDLIARIRGKTYRVRI